MRIPAHILATAFSDEVRDGKNSLFRPIENVRAGMDYLASSQTDAQYNSRFGQVCHDIAITNLIAETCGAPGEMIAGDYANQTADEYVQQIIEDEAFPQEDDEIARSFRLKLRGGPGSKGMPAGFGKIEPLFNGIGLFKENLPEGSRSNPITSLPTCRRRTDRPLWTYKFFSTGRSGFIVQRCYYSIYLIKIVNCYFKSNIITFGLMTISYVFYCISMCYFLRYINNEINNLRLKFYIKEYCHKTSVYILNRRSHLYKRKKLVSRGGLF